MWETLNEWGRTPLQCGYAVIFAFWVFLGLIQAERRIARLEKRLDDLYGDHTPLT
jgi:hypothetical protein